MRKMKLLSVFVLLALLLSASSAGVTAQKPPEQVPARVPPDEVPAEVNVAVLSESLQVPPSESEVAGGEPVPERVPDHQVPEVVNKVEFKEVITVPIADVGLAQSFGTLSPGTITLTYRRAAA